MNPPPSTSIAPVSAATLKPYVPTAWIDFSPPAERAAFEKALATVRGELGREYPAVIGGERVKGSGTFESRNPARPSEISRYAYPSACASRAAFRIVCMGPQHTISASRAA